MIVFNFRAISLQLRNFVRRHKWRLRPLKAAVLPARAAGRALKQKVVPPPHIEASILDYAAVHTEISVREIHPAESVSIPLSPFADNARTGVERSAPAFIFEIPNIDFWAHYGGAVITADKALLAELSPEVWGTAHHPIFSRWRLPKAQTLAGRIGIAVTPEAPGNYYHWLLDAVPRLLLLRHATGNFANYDSVLINGSRTGYETESLAVIGVPPEKIRYVDTHDRFRIASALIPSMDHRAPTIAPWKIAALRQLVIDGSAQRRLYISRRRAPVRRIANEDEIAPLLRAYGFEIIQLEEYSWSEQARIFAGAEIVIAPHGAALANAAFSPAGTRMIEISTRAGYRDWYLHLAAAGQLNYRCIEATTVKSSRPGSHRAHENDDMVVSLEKMEQFLSAL